jgi:hypothetical protein
MTKIRQRGYVFITWIGDHPPRHVHIYRDGKLIVKFDLERWKVMSGKMSSRIFMVLTELRRQGQL